jgi:ABC-2 type transport system permease protein
MIPEKYLPLFKLNPMFPIINAYRSILYEGTTPDMSTLLMSLVVGLFFLVVGYYTFRKLQVRFAEEL